MPRNVEFKDVYRHLGEDDDAVVVLENRNMKWMFGTLNYGEVPGYRNEADGDCWDVFAPGYARRLPFGVPYRVRDVLGVLWLENHNHKIAVALDVPGFHAGAAAREIERYAEEYCRRVKVKGVWIPKRTLRAIFGRRDRRKASSR